jgi:transposase InsO family protein
VSRLKERHAEVSLQTICELFGYTRQAYYKNLRSNNEGVVDDCRILIHVGEIRKLMPRLGTRKLHYMLQEQGVDISRDRLFDLLRENKMLVHKRKKYTVTTNSKHWMKKYPNMIRGFKFDKPNQLWVSDITYIPIDNTHAYLSLITDACSRKILGYCLYNSLASEGSLKALEMAILDNTVSLNGLIHHSDRGVQYCCKEYVELLKANNIRISMTENGDPYENALAERVNGILKDEWLSLEKFNNFEQAKERIDQVIKIYNEVRPHLSCGMKTPAQKHNSKLPPKKN